MKLAVDVSGWLILDLAENSGPILAALDKAVLADRDWQTQQFIPTGKVINMSIIEESKLGEPKPIDQKLKEEADRHRDMWHSEYTEHQLTKAKLKEAEDKLESIGDSFNKLTKDNETVELTDDIPY